MAEPSLAIQAAVVATLLNDSGVTSLGTPPIGTRIYDRVPPGALFPYITYGLDQVNEDDSGDCGNAWEVFVPLHIWSRAVGQPEMKNISGAIRTLLHNNLMPVTGFNLVIFEHRTTNYLGDPDGLTQHARLDFRALIE